METIDLTKLFSFSVKTRRKVSMGNSQPKPMPADILKAITHQACADNMNYSRKYKVLVAGTRGVGKTTFRDVLKGDEFESSRKKSFGRNGVHLDFPFRGETFHLCLHDTAGIEHNETFVYSTLRETDCLILAYAVNDQKSLNDLVDDWLPKLMTREDAKSIKYISILGTKGDLRRSASFDWIIDKDPTKLAAQHNATVSMNECSSKTGENINDFFWDMVTELAKHTPARHK